MSTTIRILSTYSTKYHTDVEALNLVAPQEGEFPRRYKVRQLWLTLVVLSLALFAVSTLTRHVRIQNATLMATVTSTLPVKGTDIRPRSEPVHITRALAHGGASKLVANERKAVLRDRAKHIGQTIARVSEEGADRTSKGESSSQILLPSTSLVTSWVLFILAFASLLVGLIWRRVVGSPQHPQQAMYSITGAHPDPESFTRPTIPMDPNLPSKSAAGPRGGQPPCAIPLNMINFHAITAVIGQIDPHVPVTTVLDALQHLYPGLDISALAGTVDHAPLGAIGGGVGLPCTVMNCGDINYRSTLDPELRRELRGIDWRAAGPALAAVVAYLFAPPNILAGALDLLVAAPVFRAKLRNYKISNIKIGKQLAVGGFGVVYTGSVGDEKIVLKQAKEFGEAETWMNERVTRAIPGVCADFLDSFVIPKKFKRKGVFGKSQEEELWLVWKYEGDCSLDDLLSKRDWPYNLEPYFFGDTTLPMEKGARYRAVLVREAMRQLMEGIRKLHSIGIVHRDLKPQNLIMSNEGSLKVIDLGAAADLRIGINYIPFESIFDPRYMPPEEFISNPSAALAPKNPFIATMLSPLLWLLESPYQYDTYTAGIILMQMCFSNLKTDDQLILFNKNLQERYNYNLQAWRDAVEEGKKFADGFEILDMDKGAGWKMLKRMLAENPSERPSAQQVLSSKFLNDTALDFSLDLGIDVNLPIPSLPIDDTMILGKGEFTEADLAYLERQAAREAERQEEKERMKAKAQRGNKNKNMATLKLADKRPPSRTIRWFDQRKRVADD